MLITEREVRRIVSIHFKEKYKIEVAPNNMKWVKDFDDMDEYGEMKWLEIGGVIDGEES